MVKLSQDEDLKDAINSFVLSLEEEQKKAVPEDKEEMNAHEQKIELNGFNKLISILKNLIGMICPDQELRITSDKEEYKLAIYGSNLANAIGKNGKNMEAIEYIINLIGKRRRLIDKKVSIDIKDYRKKNLERINKLALRMAEKVVKEGKKIVLRPMPSYERKVIHNLLSKIKEVKTRSRDEEPNRRIVIYPAANNQ